MLQYIYGYHPVMMALTPKSLIKLKKVIFVEKKYPELKKTLLKLKVPFETMPIETINNALQNSKNQGIYAIVQDYQYYSWTTILQQQSRQKFFRLLICDKITDPHNFGAIIRSAAACDFDAVIVLNRNQAEINGVVAKAAAGALSFMPICQVSNLTTLINDLKQKQFWTIAAAFNANAVDYQTIKYDFNTALIVGNEGDGVSLNLIKKVDFVAKIQMSPLVESFNASVASAILMHDIYQKTLKF